MTRIAALDVGLARIGIALSDTRKILASPLCAVAAQKSLQETAALILLELAKHGSLELLVLGLPLTLKGKDSPLCAHVRALGTLLEKHYPIVYWDERLTTAQVERTLKEAEMNRKKRSQIIDALAAAAILQNYLDFIK